MDGLKESMNDAAIAREQLGLARTYLHVAEGLGLIDEATLERLMDQRDSAARLLNELERTLPNEKTDFDARGWFDLPSSSNEMDLGVVLHLGKPSSAIHAQTDRLIPSGRLSAGRLANPSWPSPHGTLRSSGRRRDRGGVRG